MKQQAVKGIKGFAVDALHPAKQIEPPDAETSAMMIRAPDGTNCDAKAPVKTETKNTINRSTINNNAVDPTKTTALFLQHAPQQMNSAILVQTHRTYQNN